MKNVIDLTSRLKKSKASKSNTKRASAPVIDMTEARNEMISQERRKVKRTMLTEFIGACALVQGKGLLKVSLADISETGLAFDIEEGSGHFMIGEEIAMRARLSPLSAVPVSEFSTPWHKVGSYDEQTLP